MHRFKGSYTLLLTTIGSTLLGTFAASNVSGQKTTIVNPSADSTHATVIAGKQYQKGSLHNILWGNHYRKEWATPVTVDAVHLDTLMGGLVPILKGGGRQTRTLRLEDSSGHQYVLRSIDKTFGRALPEIFRGTFSENVINDQVSIAHPYAALTVPMLADAATIYHTNPRIFFLPSQKALGEFNDEFKDQLYLFEERAAGNEEDADNFGNSADVDGTEKVLDKLFEENDHRVDQHAYVKARLFDMFVSDWGRHEDQWRWASFKENGQKIYRPIPRDRDQVFTRFDGLFVRFGTKTEQLGYLQSFDYGIKEVKRYNFQARHLDRLMANETTLEVWVSTAKDLQQKLTDQVIEAAVRQLPAEIYPISGKQITEKLKARRDKLAAYAKEYYLLLAKAVDVVGTKQREIFEVNGVGPKKLEVKVYDQDSSGNKHGDPLYSRIFTSDETHEIRIYGLDGKDKYIVTGKTDDKFKIRLIGGVKSDSFNIHSDPNSDKIKVYDDAKNGFVTDHNAKLYISNDTSVHNYNYHAFSYDSKAFKPGISYSNEDRLFLTMGYHLQKQKWRKAPFGYSHDFNLNYSITQLAFSGGYHGQFTEFAGKWNLDVLVNMDEVRDAHFPGIGNNTVLSNETRNFYRMRTREFYAGIGINRRFGERDKVNFTANYQFVKVLKNPGKFIEQNRTPEFFSLDYYLGAKGEYQHEKVDNRLFPSRGFTFYTAADYTHNLKEEKSVARISGIFGFYVPVAPSLTLAIKTGAATLTGNPEFYQLSRLGGGSTLRGFLRWRYYGETAVYNQNELQYNFDVKSFLFNGKLGVLALLDNGRVWQPGETSDRWHVGYGGGVMLAPFNKITITGTVAVSHEDQRLNVRIGRLF